MSKIELVIVVSIVALLGLMFGVALRDAREWEAFSAQHNCKVVAQEQGSVQTTVAPIIGGNGGVAVGTSSTPDKTAWLCDDGVTYWRTN